jgi:phosphohistidine phosphatase
MKTIILIRHAKSSWKNKDLKDTERPLKKRGSSDAVLMAKLLKEKGLKVEKLISSPAERALATAKAFAAEIGIAETEIENDERLYMESKTKMLKLISELDEKLGTVALVSHNPALSNLANFFLDEDIGDIPTASMVAIEFDTDWWNGVEKKKGNMIFFEYPKKHRKKIEKIKSEVL